MPSWIYQDLIGDPEDSTPAFKLQSTLNWARALAFEISSEHGQDSAAWNASFRRGLSPTLAAPTNPRPLLESVEPLISSVSFSLSLQSIEDQSETAAWLRPAGVVAWYYALYGAVRSMLASVAQPSGDDHRKTMRTYLSSLAGRLPHPFNMRARWIRNEEYAGHLPSVTTTTHFDLSRAFEERRDCSQGMLLQYLKGTAKHYVDRVKEKLADDFPDGFRTAAARAARDKRVEREVGLMHCAFRYRRKANYRDSLYLAYGQRNPTAAARFVRDLRTSAQAFSMLALAVLGRTSGPEALGNLREDLSSSLRDVASVAPQDRFWEFVT